MNMPAGDPVDVLLASPGGESALLYTGVAGGRFRFAPSLAALLADPAVERVVDHEQVLDHLRGRPGGGPEATLLRGVRRLPEHRPDGSDRAAATTVEGPDSVQVLTELPEAVRCHERPFAGAADYLDRRGTGAAGGGEELLGRWLRARRAQVQGVFRSPAFCGRPYWDGLAFADAFGHACAHPGASMVPFWQALNIELWLRCFVDRARSRLGLPMTWAEVTDLGDRGVRTPVPSTAAQPGRHVAMVGRDGVPYLRVPVRTRNVWPGDRLHDVVEEGLANAAVPVRAGDVLVVAEKIVAIGQGRVVRPETVQVRRLARLLARFTLRTPAGISLGLPESFEMAVREVGAARILAGAAAAAVTRPFGVRGLFYRITGPKVAAIDSPDADALPPSNRCIKLAPADPDGAARALAEQVSSRIGGRVEAAVIDVNDIGAEVLGASPGVDRSLLVSVLRDNPLGQDGQRTPVGIVRRADGRGGR